MRAEKSSLCVGQPTQSSSRGESVGEVLPGHDGTRSMKTAASLILPSADVWQLAADGVREPENCVLTSQETESR